MKKLLFAAAIAAFVLGAFADKSANITIDWRGLPNVVDILRDNSKAHYGFANFVAFGPGWQYTAQDYAAKEHKKEIVEDPKFGKGLLFTGKIWAGKTCLKIREEYYDVSKGGKARAHVRWTIANDAAGKPMNLERAYVRFPLSRAEFAGGKAGPNTLPDTYGEEWIGVGNKDDIKIVSKDGKKALLAKVVSGNPVVQDARKDKQDRFEFRIDFPNQKEGSSSTIEFELGGSLTIPTRRARARSSSTFRRRPRKSSLTTTGSCSRSRTRSTPVRFSTSRRSARSTLRPASTVS